MEERKWLYPVRVDLRGWYSLTSDMTFSPSGGRARDGSSLIKSFFLSRLLPSQRSHAYTRYTARKAQLPILPVPQKLPTNSLPLNSPNQPHPLRPCPPNPTPTPPIIKTHPPNPLPKNPPLPLNNNSPLPRLPNKLHPQPTLRPRNRYKRRNENYPPRIIPHFPQQPQFLFR